MVIETGLGGRLDATNVLEKPAVCVITSISKDHMQYLGTTIPEIAGRRLVSLKPVCLWYLMIQMQSLGQ